MFEIGGGIAAGLLDELVEEGVFAVVGRPDSHVGSPGDAALGGFPEKPGIGMFGEFIEANIAAIDGHGLRMRRESANGGAVVEFDVAHFQFVGEARRMALLIEARDFVGFLAVGDDETSGIEKISHLSAQAHVLEGALIIFGGKEIIAIFKAEAFADIFESVGIGPADADGFFSEGKGLLSQGMDGVFSLNPMDLVGYEEAREQGVAVDSNARDDEGHGRS